MRTPAFAPGFNVFTMNPSRFVLCWLLLLLVACSDPESAKRREVEKGKELVSRGAPEEGRLRFQKALSIDSNYAEAHYQIGLLELQAGKAMEAYQALSRAAELEGNNWDAQVKTADLALAIYANNPSLGAAYFRRAENVAEKLGLKNPNDYDALRIRGYLRRLERKEEEAVSLFQQAQKQKPQAVEVVAGEADALRQLGRKAEAKARMEAFLASNAQSKPAYDYLYSLALEDKRLEDAGKLAEQRAQQFPKDLQVQLELCGHYARAGLNEKERDTKVRACVSRATQSFGNKEEDQLSLGRFHLAYGYFAEALPYLERAAGGKGKVRQDALEASARALGRLRRWPEALEKAKAARQESGGSVELQALEARLLVEAGRPEEAQAMLSRLVNEDARLHADLARVLEARGDRKGAMREWKSYLSRQSNDVAARESLARLLDEERDFAGALQEADLVLQANPESARAQLIRARALMGLGRIEEAKKEVQKAAGQKDLSSEFTLQQGYLQVAEKKWNEAELSFRKVYRAGQRDLRAVSGLVEVAFGRQKPEEAARIAWADLKAAEAPELTRPWAAGVAARAGQFDLAIEQYKRAIAKNPNDPNLYLALGEVERRKGDGDAARKSLERARDQAPGSQAPELALGLEALGRRQWEEAEGHFRKALAIQANDAAAKNNLAYALAEQGKKLDEALRLAMEGSGKNNPNYDDTLAFVLLKRKEYEAAEKVWLRLARQDAQNMTYPLRLAETKWAKGERSAAKGYLLAAEKLVRGAGERAELERVRGLLR